MLTARRSFRPFLFMLSLCIVPLLSNCVCSPPRIRQVLPRCSSPRDCAANQVCIRGRCENNSTQCSNGIRKSCTVNSNSSCTFGEQVCTGGRWGTCRPTKVGATTEVCDGVDNDCDGRVDETFPEAGRRCVVLGAKGPCASGVYRLCVKGSLKCSSSSKPRPEGESYANCTDGIDNDCDGFIDDPDRDGCSKCKNGEVQKCYPYGQGIQDPTVGIGRCKVGTRTCSNGSWLPCSSAVTPQDEICDNKADDDCDGQIDEGCSQQKCEAVGSRRPCYNGPAVNKNVGLCVTGTQTCEANRIWGKCIGAVLPVKEICGDKKDNDCNGKVDDCGSTQDCTPGESRSCYTGAAKTQNIGLCKAGKESCSVHGKWSGKCTAEVLPVKEVCGDKKDNDCNGKVDDCTSSANIFASSSWDKLRSIQMWDSLNNTPIRSFSAVHTDTVYSVRFSFDGKALYSCGHDKRVVAWDSTTAKVLWQMSDHTDAVHAIAVDPKGKWIASGSADSNIHLRDPKTGKTFQMLTEHSGAIYALAVDATGKYLASGSADTTVRIWDVSTRPAKPLHILKAHTREIFSLAFHPTKASLASGSNDNSVILWDAQTGSLIRTLFKHTKSVTSLSFDTKGEILATGGADEKVMLWNTKGVVPVFIKELAKPASGAVYALAFSPKKNSLYAGYYKGKIFIWDTVKGTVSKTLTLHSAPVSSISFHP